MAAEQLDAAALHFLFSTFLSGPDIAACAQVCHTWRAVAASEVLWQRQCEQLEPHTHLRRDDLLPEFGGSHRCYFAWRFPLLRRPLGRILVEADEEEAGWPQIATYPAPQLASSSGSSGSGGGGGGSQQQQAMDVDGGDASAGIIGGGGWGAAQEHGAAEVACIEEALVQQATLSPSGAMVAFTELVVVGSGQLDCHVVVADARTGRRLAHRTLARPNPPFYFYWAPCGTRLLFLSNWEGDVVALRTLDVAPALLPPVPGQPAPRQLGPEVLLCTARPLFLATSPTSTRLVWHGNCREWGLCDAATQVDEDGAEHDCFAFNSLDCRCQAPQWLVDAQAVEWLLLPVMHVAPPGGGPAGDAGALVLAPLAALSEAYEADGSRLSPTLLLSLSQHVADFSSARDLCFAATADAGMVAWCDCGQLLVRWQQTGAVHAIWPRPQQEQAAAQDQQRGRGGRCGSSLLAQPWLNRGAVIAMQWSPNCRRLLFLLHGGPAPMVALSKQPKYRWVVYDPPSTPPPLHLEPGAAPGWLGALTACCPFNPTLEFLDRYLPFFDQYARSMQLFDSTSSAFCFAARGRPSEGLVSEEPNISVQPVSRPEEAASSSGTSSGQAADTVGALPLTVAEAPPPVWLARGNMASWSWQ